LDDGNALAHVGSLLAFLINIYCWILVIRVLLSWFHPSPDAPVTRLLLKITDPAINFTRRACPLRLGGLDCSPVILLISLYILAFLAKISLAYLGRGGPAVGLLGILALGVIQALIMATWFLFLLMVARVIISLVNPSPYNPLVMMIMALTEPLVAPLRGAVPMRGPGGLDIRAVILCAVLLIFHSVILMNLGGPVQGWIKDLLLTPKPFEPRIY
jgi:YggT family protein